jgi:hypothetical protein
MPSRPLIRLGGWSEESIAGTQCNELHSSDGKGEGRSNSNLRSQQSATPIILH